MHEGRLDKVGADSTDKQQQHSCASHTLQAVLQLVQPHRAKRLQCSLTVRYRPQEVAS